VQSEAEPRWLLEKRVSEENDFSDNAARFYSHGKTTIIAEVGDVMPDGGTLAKVGTAGQDIAMNNAGDVVFDGMLTDGTQAIYLWRHGLLSLVTKTGTRQKGICPSAAANSSIR